MINAQISWVMIFISVLFAVFLLVVILACPCTIDSIGDFVFKIVSKIRAYKYNKYVKQRRKFLKHLVENDIVKVRVKKDKKQKIKNENQ